MGKYHFFYEILINLVLLTSVFCATIEFTSGVYGNFINNRLRRDLTEAVTKASTDSAKISNSTERPYDVMVDVNAESYSKKNGENDADDNDDDEDYIVTTTQKFVRSIPGNDLYIGNCSENDKMLYIDNTVIKNDGPSILNGTIEVIILYFIWYHVKVEISTKFVK